MSRSTSRSKRAIWTHKSSVPFQSDSLIGWLAKTIEHFTANNLTYASVPSTPTESETPTTSYWKVYRLYRLYRLSWMCTGRTACAGTLRWFSAEFSNIRPQNKTFLIVKPIKLNSHKTPGTTPQASLWANAVTYLRKVTCFGTPPPLPLTL